jgi:diguanylate cyclase (GGDEF)-like protein/PAS domain S-box-containing protein
MTALLKTKRFLWGAILILVTGVALLSYFSGRRYLAAVNAVEHTLAVQSAINGTLSLLKDSETGQRGYILTADDHFLEPYRSALRDIPSLYRQLEQVTSSDPAHQAHLTALRRLIGEKHAFMERTIAARRAGNLKLPLDLVRGKALMDSIRLQCQAMLDHEQQQLAKSKLEASRSEQLAIVGVATGLVVTVALALFSWLTVHRDVQELRRTAEQLATSEEHYRMLTEQSSDLVRLLDLTGAATYVSPSVERLLGFGVAEFLALSPRSLMHPDELQAAGLILGEIQRGERLNGVSTYRLRKKSDQYRWFEVRWAVRRDEQGQARELHTVGRDVTERLEAEQLLREQADQLRTLALRDQLTGLYNRRGFMEVAAQAHSVAIRDRRAAALLFVDLNGMKRINDELGHDAGDLAISDSAFVLSRALRDADVIARLGGDEFVVFALDFAPTQQAGLQRRLREACDLRTRELARPFRLSMSIGGAFMPVGALTPLQRLLDEADTAMYAQKNARRLAGDVSLPPPPLEADDSIRS